MKNINYKPVQVPVDAYDILKEYCDMNGLYLGKFLERLINENCKNRVKLKTPMETTGVKLSSK